MWSFDPSQIALYAIASCGICLVLYLAFIPMQSIRIKGVLILIVYLVVAVGAALVSAALKQADVSVLLTRAIVFEGFPSLIALLTSLLTFINTKIINSGKEKQQETQK